MCLLGCFWKTLAFELVDWGRRSTLAKVVGIIHYWGPKKNKEEEEGWTLSLSLSLSLSGDTHFFLGFNIWALELGTSLVAQMVKCLPTMQETQVQSLGQEDLLEKEIATHSSILAWKIPWTEEPGWLQSTGWQRVGHDWATSLSLSLVLGSSDLNWSLSLAFLFLQLADGISWHISASIIMWTSCQNAFFYISLYMLLVLFLWRALL